ncbi:MAG: glycosyl transferase family 1 [Fibrobacteres bacterium]|nr:glycosyl transferase family 1 [Fibrobacterota bacterium]
MKITLLTNEFPPYVYGGAGVHVEYLSKALACFPDRENQVDILCFGDQKIQEGTLTARGLKPDFALPAQSPQFAKLMDTLARNVMMSGAASAMDIVHCHTWYTHFGGCILKKLFGAPLVLTTHSLEPHRPWKVEQLGNAYHVSTWLERTAYENADGVVAVSESMKRDVHELYGVPHDRIRVIPNGIDLEEYHPSPDPALLGAYGIDPALPFVLFVGRITRQKGVLHLINAIRHLRPGTQVVLCAGAPDTPEIGEEMKRKVEEARKDSSHSIIWIPQMLPKREIISLYTHASVFICPSVYEPFGIINLEAMACETPVVASRVGGIPEVVVPGETGFLVPFDPKSAEDFEPKDPERYSRDLAAAANTLLDNGELRQSMAKKARKRVEDHFAWTQVARRTHHFYQELIQNHGRP